MTSQHSALIHSDHPQSWGGSSLHLCVISSPSLGHQASLCIVYVVHTEYFSYTGASWSIVFGLLAQHCPSLHTLHFSIQSRHRQWHHAQSGIQQQHSLSNNVLVSVSNINAGTSLIVRTSTSTGTSVSISAHSVPTM